MNRPLRMTIDRVILSLRALTIQFVSPKVPLTSEIYITDILDIHVVSVKCLQANNNTNRGRRGALFRKGAQRRPQFPLQYLVIFIALIN